jgi:hypothetical protein
MYAPGSAASGPASSGQSTLSATTVGARVRLVLHDAPAHAQVLVLMSHPPLSVSVDGQVLPRAADAAALRVASMGWMFSPGEFGGVLVKLSAASGTGTVQITS